MTSYGKKGGGGLKMFLLCVFTLGCCLAVCTRAARTQQAKKPITKQGLVKALRLNALTTKELVQQVQSRGVEFQMDADDEGELRGAGARPELLAAVRTNYRAAARPPLDQGSAQPDTANPQPGVPSGPPLSKGEVVTLLQSGLPAARVEQFVEVRGVSFVSTPETAKEIMAAGGTRSLIGAIGEKAIVPTETNPPADSGRAAELTAKVSPDYDELTDQATEAMSQDPNSAIRILRRAIDLDQAKPAAYSLLGFAQLYGQQNIEAAVEPMRAALERGGAAVFRVYHDHDGGFGSHCQGSFFITRSGVSFKSDDGNDTFEVEDTNIKEAKANSLVGAQYGAFHVKLSKEAGGRNYNFAPATQQKAESQLITSLIREY